MDNAHEQAGSQAKLPPGFFKGVMPPDGVQLAIELWMHILGVDPVDQDRFVRRIRDAKIARGSLCGSTFIDSTHIRKLFSSGKGAD